MMYVNESASDGSIDLTEIEATNNTCRPIVRNTGRPGGPASLVGVDRNLLHGSFSLGSGRIYFVAEELLS